MERYDINTVSEKSFYFLLSFTNYAHNEPEQIKLDEDFVLDFHACKSVLNGLDHFVVDTGLVTMVLARGVSDC